MSHVPCPRAIALHFLGSTVVKVYDRPELLSAALYRCSLCRDDELSLPRLLLGLGAT